MPFASLLPFLDPRTGHRLLIQAVLAFVMGVAWQAVDAAPAPSTGAQFDACGQALATGPGDESPRRAPKAADPVKKSRRHLVSLVDLPPGPAAGFVVVADTGFAPARAAVAYLPRDRDAYRPPSPAAEVRFLPLRGQPPPPRA